MRFRALVPALIVFVSTLVSAPLLADGSASGRFHVAVDAGTMNIEFDARSTGSSSGGTGSIALRTPIVLTQDEDHPFGPTGLTDLSAKVDIDCVRVSGTRASMSGIVRDASVIGFTGRRVLLTVEAPDKFTWGIYNVEKPAWFPTDAERDVDNGATLQWTARDFEHDDDAAIQVSGREARDTTCSSFGLASYDLVALPRGSGDIRVTP